MAFANPDIVSSNLATDVSLGQMAVPVRNKLFPHFKVLEKTRTKFDMVMWFLNISSQGNHALEE